MTSAALIIQKVSFDHISHVARFIHAELAKHFGPDTGLIVCDEIDNATHPDNAVIFVIGEGFQPHRRRPGCFYVYLNFSIVSVMGNPLQLSKVGWSAIRRKRRMLAEKQSGFDLLLDYFAPQTRRLQRQLDIPVLGFDIGVDPALIDRTVPPADRPYDICFVGAMTPRRQQVIAELEGSGLTISPHSGVVYEDIAAQSRCCINIHAYRSNHLEIPRIIGAVAAGTPVVTELSYGLQTLIPSDLVKTSGLRQLPKIARNLCRDPFALQNMQARSFNWYEQSYLPHCRQNWADICVKIKTQFQLFFQSGETNKLKV
ncbi:hypothetical protein [Yoonia sp. SDW83-1]|uniref:hypothetical protein n=1 Tax=Yoonia sp. SDW83-1 TaxID=3366945 RepID=UPI00398C5A1F